MINVIKIVLFLLVNMAGYYTIPMLVWITVTAGIFPQIPPGPIMESFKMMLLGGGTWVWIAAALASVGYFFVPPRELRTWLILAPMYCPAIYGMSVLLYYKFFAAV
ncbi:MAG TPA: hypothetical protein VIG74_05780 [Alphaproteobacteria bacterium]